jgi:hypothetical protein
VFLNLKLLAVDYIVRHAPAIMEIIHVISAILDRYFLMGNVLLASLDAMFAAIKI